MRKASRSGLTRGRASACGSDLLDGTLDNLARNDVHGLTRRALRAASGSAANLRESTF